VFVIAAVKYLSEWLDLKQTNLNKKSDETLKPVKKSVADRR